MNCAEITATIKELRRYWDRDLKKARPGGPFVRSTVIPRATRAEYRKAEERADGDHVRSLDVRWVPVRYLIAEQKMLLRDSLLYAARTYVEHQKKGEKIPTLVCVGRGRYFVRDGNHRATVALMIGDRDLRIRAYVVGSRIRKKRLTRRAKHG